MKTYKQSGLNAKYPLTIETWKFGEQPIPEWISDICKIKKVDESGNLSLEFRETNKGGVELINSVGNKVVLTIPNKEDYVCWGDGKLFTLRPIQLELLYKTIEKRGN